MHVNIYKHAWGVFSQRVETHAACDVILHNQTKRGHVQFNDSYDPEVIDERKKKDKEWNQKGLILNCSAYAFASDQEPKRMEGGKSYLVEWPYIEQVVTST